MGDDDNNAAEEASKESLQKDCERVVSILKSLKRGIQECMEALPVEKDEPQL